MTRGQLFVVSAASGAGKTSLMKQLTSSMHDLEVSISHTTRMKRPGEVEGQDYCFVDTAVFKQMQRQGEFLESAEVFGNFYGTSLQAVEAKLAQGVDIILEIDWQGERLVKETGLSVVTIFVLPPSATALRERLHGRGQDDQETIKKRLEQASNENSHYNEYDYLIVNDDFDRALYDLQAIVHSQRLRRLRQEVKYAELLRSLIDFNS